MLYSAAKEEEELKQRIKILGGRQGAKASSKLRSLYKSLPEGATPEAYDKWYKEGGDATFQDWNERKDRKPGEMTEWNTGMKITDKAQPLKSTGGAASKLTPANIATAANAATGVLNALDMLSGGQDTILPGSGHTYSSGYNPQMYIGTTV